MRPAGTLRLALVAVTILTCGCLSNNKGQIEGTKWTSLAGTIKGNPTPPGAMEVEFMNDGTLHATRGMRQLTGTYSLGTGDSVVLNLGEELNGRKQHAEMIAINGDRLTMTDSDGTMITFSKVAGTADWKIFESEAGRFAILTPAEFTEQVEPAPTPIGKIDTHIFIGFIGAREHTVNYADYPREFPSADIADKVLDAVQSGVVNALNGKLLNETKVSVDSHPGREITFDGVSPDGMPFTCRARFYLVRNRLYQIQVSAAKDHLPIRSTDKFIQSFKLLN